MGTPQPPSVVELFLAAVCLQPGTRAECIRSAETGFVRTDCYELSFVELLDTLRVLDWTCVGAVGSSPSSAVRFLAALAHSLGMRVLMPRATWVRPTSPVDASLHFAAYLPSRAHLASASLLSDLRLFPCSLSSFSAWVLSRPLTFVGPGVSLSSTVRECFLFALAGLRANANSFRLRSLSPLSFLDGLAALPGIVSVVGSEFSTSLADTTGSDCLSIDSDLGGPCPDDVVSSPSDIERN